jgi:anti-anti-sigma factor
MISTKEEKDALVIAFTEAKMSMHISTALFKELEATLSTPRELIYLDMDVVDSIDSSIVGVLVRFHKISKERKKKLVFRHLTPTMIQLFKLTRMYTYLNVES